jgi:predicted site-specific integrase-resolvase
MQLERDRKLLTPREVGDLFRVNPRTVNRWGKNGTLGQLTQVRTPTGHLRYWEDEVLALRDCAG